jgi:ribulose kinase
MNREAAAVPPGCEGLVTLDHFQGNRTPFTDPLSRGVLSGLTLKHGRAHVFRSILEGVAFGTHLILQTMRANGFAPAEVVIAGGATASPLWVQIHADVAGLPFRLTRCTDAPALGSAILAAVAGGCFADVRRCAQVYALWGCKRCPSLLANPARCRVRWTSSWPHAETHAAH